MTNSEIFFGKVGFRTEAAGKGLVCMIFVTPSQFTHYRNASMLA